MADQESHLRIRAVTPLYLAPMAGVTDWPFRLLCFEQGCAGATTEMVSAVGYLTAPRDGNAYRFLTETSPLEGALVVQIFGKEPDMMARAAMKLTESGRFCGIDINMGCPAHKVTGGGAGSALMLNLPLAQTIIASVVKSTPLPVSVKMRLGWDEAHLCAPELALRAQDAGAKLITVHGRTREQQYAGRADWERIAGVKRAVSIPVILNGDITDKESAEKAISVSGCDGLAIGRGALGNPWIFGVINGKSAPDDAQIIQTALRHARMMADWKGEDWAALEMRKHIAWYIKNKRGAAKLRARVFSARSFEEMEALLHEYGG